MATSGPRDILARMTARTFEEHLAEALVAAWSDAVPTLALIALWARGDVAPVHAIAGGLSVDRRAGLLAWLAGQDPEPGAPHVERAAKEALRLAAGSSALLPVLALVPLDKRPAVAALARRQAGGSVVLSLRAGGEPWPPAELERLFAGVLHALNAVALAERGRQEEADAALAAACEWPAGDETHDLAMVPSFMRLRAWERLRHRSRPAVLWAAFVGGRADPAGVQRLLTDCDDGGLYAAATLGAGSPEEPWREHLVGMTEERLEELWAEGLIDEDDRWCSRFAGALGEPRAYEAVTGLVHAALAVAHASARRLAEKLAGAAPPDEDREAERGRRARQLKGVAIDERGSYRTLRRCLQSARRLSELGAADAVREAVEAIEGRWGPARQWGRETGWIRDPVVELTAELLACAEGRAREALELCPDDASSSTRARICAGLAREGHVDALRAPFAALLPEVLRPADVVALASAARVLEPDAEDRRRAAIARALEELPATPEGARDWLAACDRPGLRRSRRGHARV